MFGKGFRLYSTSLKCKTVPFKMFLMLTFAYFAGKESSKKMCSPAVYVGGKHKLKVLC